MSNHNCVAQKQDFQWVVGYEAQPTDTTSWGGTLINFKNGIFQADTIGSDLEANIRQCYGGICDEQGNLLLYTNGTEIYDKHHQIIENGDSLHYGNSSIPREWGSAINQGALILPIPGQQNRFVLFHETVTIANSDIFIDGLYKSIIEINNDYPNGIVLSKNERIIDDILDGGKITAVKHANGIDWWVILLNEQGFYYRIFISESDLKIEKNELEVPETFDGDTGAGWFNNNGTMFARNIYKNQEDGFIELYDFDRCSGEFIFRISFELKNDLNISTLSFSPNGRFLYYNTNIDLLQMDLENDYEIDTIASFDFYVDSISGLSCPFQGLYSVPDGRIFLNTHNTCFVINTINKPNEKGAACDFRPQSIHLPYRYNRTIPNFPNYRLGPLKGSACYPIDDRDINFNIYPNPSHGLFTISTDSNIGLNGIISIYDPLGRFVTKRKIVSNTAEHHLDFSDLPSNVYFWKFENHYGNDLEGKVIKI